MYDIVRDALIWAMSQFLDRQPQGGEALRMLSAIIFSALATGAGVNWRGFAYRAPPIRRRLLTDERYTGRYLQAIRRGTEIRYAIVHIYYNRRNGRFEAVGRSYNPSGEEISSFRSGHVIFPPYRDGSIEFNWQGNRASGYTRMKIERAQDSYIEGDGFIINFSMHPKVFPMLFKYLHWEHVRQALGIDPPAHASAEPDFIRTFHDRLGGAVQAAFENTAEEVV